MTNLVAITVKATDESDWDGIKAEAAAEGAEAAEAFNSAFRLNASVSGAGEGAAGGAERMAGGGVADTEGLAGGALGGSEILGADALDEGLLGEDASMLGRLKSEIANPGGVGLLGTGTDSSLLAMLKNEIREASENGDLGLLGGSTAAAAGAAPGLGNLSTEDVIHPEVDDSDIAALGAKDGSTYSEAFDAAARDVGQGIADSIDTADVGARGAADGGEYAEGFSGALAEGAAGMGTGIDAGLEESLDKAYADYAGLIAEMNDLRMPDILAAMPDLNDFDMQLHQLGEDLEGVAGPAGISASALEDVGMRIEAAGNALDEFEQQMPQALADLAEFGEAAGAVSIQLSPDMYANATREMEQAGEEAGAGFAQGAAAGIGQEGSALTDGVGDLFDGASEDAEDEGDAAGSGFIQGLTSKLTGVEISPLMATVATGLLAFGPAIAGTVAGLGMVGAAFGAAAVAGGGLDSVASRLKSDFENGAEGVSGFGSAVESVGSQSLQDFGRAAGLAGAAVGQLFVTFAPEIEKAAGWVEDIAEDFDNWAKGVSSSGLDSMMSKIFDPQNMQELETDLGDILAILKNVGEAIGMLSPAVLTDLTGALDVIKDIPPGVIAGLIALFAGMKVIGALSGPVTSAVDWLQGLLGSGEEDTGEAEAAGTEAGEAYSGGFEAGLSGMAGAVSEALGTLAAGGGEAGGAGEEAGMAYAGGFETGLTGMAGAVTEAIGTLAAGGAEAGGAGEETGMAYATGVETGVAGIAGVAEEAMGAMAAGAGEAGSVGEEMGEALVGGFGAAVEELPDVLMAAAAAMAEVAADGGEAAGVAMGEGMAAGLAEAAPLVEAEAAEIAEVAAETIAAVLLISSPSKVGRGLGKNLGAGFALGMHDMLGDVADAAGSLADMSVSSLSDLANSHAAGSLGSLGVPGAGGGGQGGSGGGIHVTVELGESFSKVGLSASQLKDIRYAVRTVGGGDVQKAFGH